MEQLNARTLNIFSPSIPQSLNPSIPQSLNPSIPQSLSPSIPQSLNPSVLQSLNPSIPQSLNPSVLQSFSPSTVTESVSVHLSNNCRLVSPKTGCTNSGAISTNGFKTNLRSIILGWGMLRSGWLKTISP